jgi:hypothetical protein
MGFAQCFVAARQGEYCPLKKKILLRLLPPEKDGFTVCHKRKSGHDSAYSARQPEKCHAGIFLPVRKRCAAEVDHDGKRTAL